VSGVVAAFAGSVSVVDRAPALDTELANRPSFRLIKSFSTKEAPLMAFNLRFAEATCRLIQHVTSVGANRPIVRYSLVGSGETDSHKEPECVE